MSFNDFRCFVIFFSCFVRLIDCASNETGISSKSQARFVPPPPPFAPPLLYPTNAATGILVAIAVPVPTDNLNVFVSYNFEGNYNMPNIPSQSFPGPLQRLKLTEPYPDVDADEDRTPDDIIARNLKAEALETEAATKIPVNDDPQEARQMMKRSVNDDKMLFTRRGVYHVLESRLEANGIEGKKCMLLAICESAAISFLEDNGVLGHILHVILTPSSSMDENLPSEYAKAEQLGRAGKCQKYMKRCNFNVLNMISKIL